MDSHASVKEQKQMKKQNGYDLDTSTFGRNFT